MKINILRFVDTDTIDVTIKTGVTGTEDITNLADKMSKLDKSVENAKVQLNAFKQLMKNLSTHSTTTLKNDLTKIKAAFDSVAAMKILPADVKKSMQQLSTIFNIADKPKQLDKTIKSVNSLLDIYDKYENVRGYSTTEEEKEDENKGDYTTNRHQSIISTVGPVKELTLGYKSLLQQEQSNINVMTKLYSAYNNIGSATKTAKTHIVTFDDAVKVNVKTLEDEQKALEKYLTVSKSSSFLKTGGDTGVTSLLATTGSLQSTNNQFNNLQTYSFGVVNALTDATKGLYNVGDAALTNQPKVAAFGDMIESATQKLKANTDELTKNQTATNNYQSALSLTSTFGGGGDIAKMAASGFDKSTVSLIQEVNNALTQTGAVMTDVAGKSQTLNNNINKSKDVFEKFKNILQKVPKDLNDVEKGFRSLSLVRLTYLWNGIKRVSSSFVQAVENAANYEESLNLYKMSIGERYIDDAEKWSREITDKLLIDESELMQYMGTYNNLAEGLGVHRDDAYEMSKALTQLTYDMSSYLNIDPSAAATKLQSAMSGQARAIQGVGVAIQSASLQELAHELGIKKKVTEMSQAEKTYLRYIQIMRNTEHMQGDLGATMITPANAIRILKTQITLLGRAIGQVLTPIIMKVIPWIMAFTSALTKAAQKLAAFLGYKIQDVNMGDAFYNASDAVDDYADSAEDASKKIKNSLAPFDELNVVMSSSGNGGDISDSSVLDILRQEVEGYDMLERYTDDLKKKAEELEKTLLPLFAGIVAFVGGKKILDLVVGFSKLKGALDGAATSSLTLGQYLGTLAKIGAIAISIAVIIYCGKKIYDDFQVLKKDLVAALQPEVEQKQSGEVKANLNSLNEDIASGAITQNTQEHVDNTMANMRQIVSNMNGVQDQFKGTNAIMNKIAGTTQGWRNRLTEVLSRYKTVNQQTRTLINNTTLTKEQAKAVKEELKDQRDALKEQLTHLTKGSEKYKLTEEALAETKGLIKDINNQYFPELKEQAKEFENSFKNDSLFTKDIMERTGKTTENISKANETLSTSETKTGLLSKAVGFVKDLFGDITGGVQTINDKLTGSNTATGTWKDNLATVEGTIFEKITKPFSNFVSMFTSKKKLTVDTKDADTTVNDLVTKSNKLSSTKTLKIKADTVNANSVIQKLFGGESLLGKLTKKLGFDVDFFADGGYPTSGELFFANENGRAEFITSVGGKTAVANQDQMVQALTNAIMAGFAMTAPRSESKQPINVNIGNERVYSGMIDYQNRQSDRYGTTTTLNI